MIKIALNITLFMLIFALGYQVRAEVKTENNNTRIIFEGNRFFSHDQLVSAMGLNGGPLQLEVDDISRNIQNLRFFLADQGFLKYSVSEVKSLTTTTGHIVTIRIDEGIRYRFGEITINGAAIFTPAQVLEFSGIRTGDIISVTKIREGIFERLREEYGNLGFIRAMVDLNESFRPVPAGADEGIVDYQINIDEGQPYAIRKIEFKGNRSQTDQVLLNELLIKPGTRFNQKLFELSLKQLDQMGIFKPLGEFNTEFKVTEDEASNYLDIIITVKERQSIDAKERESIDGRPHLIH